MRPILRQGMAALLSATMFCTGCMKTQVSMVGRCEKPIGESAQTVRHTGVYTAKWTDSDRDHLHTIHGSSRFAATGEKLGFQRYANGQVVATHGDVRLAIAGAPPTAKYLVWTHKSTVKTQFGREVDKARNGAGEVLVGVGVVVLVVAVVGGLLYLDMTSKPSSSCDSQY